MNAQKQFHVKKKFEQKKKKFDDAIKIKSERSIRSMCTHFCFYSFAKVEKYSEFRNFAKIAISLDDVDSVVQYPIGPNGLLSCQRQHQRSTATKCIHKSTVQRNVMTQNVCVHLFFLSVSLLHIAFFLLSIRSHFHIHIDIHI